MVELSLTEPVGWLMQGWCDAGPHGRAAVRKKPLPSFRGDRRDASSERRRAGAPHRRRVRSNNRGGLLKHRSLLAAALDMESAVFKSRGVLEQITACAGE